MNSLNLELPTYSEIRAEREAALEAARRGRARAARRSYDGARRDRLTNDFTVVDTSANWELRLSLRYLRARSRSLARNNDYVKKFLSLCRNNVAGPAGMKLQARAEARDGVLDGVLNRQVERAWARWGHAETASASGRLSWAGIQRKAVTMLARDGECVIREMVSGNAYGYTLKFYSPSWLDETFTERLPGGNRVIMSVEIDEDDRPVAYWLTPPSADLQFLQHPRTRRRTRVPAEEIIHLFLGDDENADDDSQTRGVPWIHTAITRLKMLGAYEEAEIVSARVSAAKQGFFVEQEGDGEEYDGDEADDETPSAPLVMSATPGHFDIVPKGFKFEKWDPSHPNNSYGTFVKGVLRGIAAGLDVTYFSLAEDLEGVNYSSARIGLLAERDVWRGLQNFLIEHLGRRVFLGWLRSSMLTGALPLRPADLERLSEPVFQPRGWKWVDPYKEGQAHKLGLEQGWETLTDIIAEQGGDIEETLTTRAAEQKMIEEKGVKLAPLGGAASPGEPAGDDDGDGTQTPLEK